MYPKQRFRNLRVFLIAICVNIMSFSIGTFIGWTSPVMPKLRYQTADSPLKFGVTASQEGWISSMLSIGAITVPFFIGSLATKIGRKWTLLLLSTFITVSNIFLILATDVWYIYVARFLQGFGGGGGINVIAIYSGEIVTDDSRGAVGTLMTLFIIGGTLFTYIIGSQVDYITLQYCCMVVPILFFVTFFFMPETPYYFAIKGQKGDLINSLKILRGKSAYEVEEEAIKIQKEVDESMFNKSRIIDIFRNRAYRKALFIICGLLVFHEMSGNNAVTHNSQSIFINAGSTLDPASATIVLCMVQLIANLLTPFVIERAGRRQILFVSAIGIGIPLMVLGTFFYIKAFGDASNILWVPVPALIMFRAFYGFGFGPLPWAMMGEMFPSNIKPTATAIACSVTYMLSFVVTRWFPELNALGAYYAFWIFGGFCGLAFFFVKYVVIETKGLSLQMIQDKLQVLK